MQITRTLLVLTAGAALLSTVALAEPGYWTPVDRGNALSITIGKAADGDFFGGIKIVAQEDRARYRGDGNYKEERQQWAHEQRDREYRAQQKREQQLADEQRIHDYRTGLHASLENHRHNEQAKSDRQYKDNANTDRHQNDHHDSKR